MKEKCKELYTNYLNKINSKKVNVGIIGMGYVGLPLALSFCEKGIKVIGIDINKKVIDLLNGGESHIHHIDSRTINKYLQGRLLNVTDDFSCVRNIDAILICVPTPLKENKEPDLSFLLSCIKSIKKYLRKGQLLSIESTTFPGTTNDIVQPIIESLNLEVGKDFFLIYSPEREDPGNNEFQTNQIPKVIGADKLSCKKIGQKLYGLINPNIISLSSSKAAETTKLLENIYRAVNIGLVNELKELTDAMDLDIYEIIQAASTKPFGYKPFYPGPGVGGHCIPVDPFYLSWKAKSYGIKTKFIDLAHEINSKMPSFVIKKLSQVFSKINKEIKNSKILILGISYKKNIDDLRESPSLLIINILQEMGAIVSYSDPYFTDLNPPNKFNLKLKSTELSKLNISYQDCVILITDHDSFNYEDIEKYSKLIIDTRGKYKKSEKIIRA